jgi:hypothetical protein
MNKLFADYANQLSAHYNLSNISHSANAPSRTSSNREALVAEFFTKILPVAIEVKQGVVGIDALGRLSRDIDIALLGGWATPVRPVSHGLVLCEGLISAILVEARWGQDAVWEQCLSVKQLLKTLKPYSSYRVSVRRTFRPVAGIWFWEGPPGSGPESANNVVVACWKRVSDAARSITMDPPAGASNWSGHQDHIDGKVPPDKLTETEYLQYQTDVGSFLPNWLYFHGVNEKQPLLLYKCQDRQMWDGDGNGWKYDGPEAAMRGDLAHLKANAIVYVHSDGTAKRFSPPTDLKRWPGSHKWGFAVYEPGDQDPHPLLILAMQMARNISVFAQETTDYGAYISGP